MVSAYASLRAPPIIVPYDIPLKNIQDMAYGTSEITTYGIFKLTYGVIFAGMTVKGYVGLFTKPSLFCCN